MRTLATLAAVPTAPAGDNPRDQDDDPVGVRVGQHPADADGPSRRHDSTTSPAQRTGRQRVVIRVALAAVTAIIFAVLGYTLGSSRANIATGSGGGGSLRGGPVDIGFAQDMLDHHDQAIQIASYALAHTSSPMVRQMAAAVISSQRYEAGVLEQFLADRGQKRGDPNRTVMGWMAMPVPHDQMPGLQPSQVMSDYLSSSGADLDKRFLTLMASHHEGGVHMAEYAADHAEDPGLRSMAARMVIDQRAEIGDYLAATQDPG